MSRQSDQSPDLPYSDELNPLLNPLLSENMGRWADVYFNNPPERREQAVLSLVHELQAEKTHCEDEKTAQPGSSPDRAQATESEHSSGRQSTAPPESDLVRCASCSHENPRFHKFCGMCGAAVVMDEKDAASASLPESTQSKREQILEENHEIDPDTPERDPERESRTEPEPFENSISNPHELSLFRSFREMDSTGYEDDEPRSHVRLYVGMALVLVILGLGYMGWKNGLFATQSSQEALPPAQSATKPAEPEATPPKAGAPETAAPAKTENPSAAATGRASENVPAEPAKPKKAVAEKAPAKASAAPKNAQPQAIADHGNQELTTAESYLNGTGGQTRNSALAAQWLWKSIAKHNGPASVLLADLYLKGDGVSKNCDQARVLLDSAAMKGVPGAGTRLRNLQAFGCQ